MSGHLIVEPAGVEQAHLHMLHAHLVHSDKPFMGSTAGAEGATQTLEMARIAFGEELGDRAVTISLVNSRSPLGYANDMLDVLLVYAKARQPMIIAALAMGGTTAPISLAGMLAMQTAELLPGLDAHPAGQPRHAGGVRLYVLERRHAPRLAEHRQPRALDADQRPRPAGPLLRHPVARRRRPDRRQLPRRTGRLRVDDRPHDDRQQRSRLHLHAAGILSSYLAFSYEKFVLDDEMCGMMRALAWGFPVDPGALAYDVIAAVGPGGNYLSEPTP